MRVYTPEQQARLNVNEEGAAVKEEEKEEEPKPADLPKPADPKPEAKPEKKKEAKKDGIHTKFVEYLKQVRSDVKNMPMWLVTMLSSLCLVLSLIALFYGRERRRQADLLNNVYASITLPAVGS